MKKQTYFHVQLVILFCTDTNSEPAPKKSRLIKDRLGLGRAGRDRDSSEHDSSEATGENTQLFEDLSTAIYLYKILVYIYSSKNVGSLPPLNLLLGNKIAIVCKLFSVLCVFFCVVLECTSLILCFVFHR